MGPVSPSSYELCRCGLRPEKHWKLAGFETWAVFLVTRGLFTSETMRERLRHPGDSAVESWESLSLATEMLQQIWHTGGLEDDPERFRRVRAEFDTGRFKDFAGAWTTARSLFVPHPQAEGALWHPRLEEVRRIECDEGGMAFSR